MPEYKVQEEKIKEAIKYKKALIDLENEIKEINKRADELLKKKKENNEKLIELEAKYEELHEAKVELARLSRDPKEAEKYRMRENAINERRNFFLETLDKGLKEGEKKAKIKIALKLKFIY